MKIYETVTVRGRLHVVCESSRSGSSFPDPNYMNTGKALCGVVAKGLTLDDWLKRHARQ